MPGVLSAGGVPPSGDDAVSSEAEGDDASPHDATSRAIDSDDATTRRFMSKGVAGAERVREQIVVLRQKRTLPPIPPRPPSAGTRKVERSVPRRVTTKSGRVSGTTRAMSSSRAKRPRAGKRATKPGSMANV